MIRDTEVGMPSTDMPLVPDHPSRGDRLALEIDGRRLTYHELCGVVRATAHAMAVALGLPSTPPPDQSPEDRSEDHEPAGQRPPTIVAVPAVAELETVVAILAALRVGIPVAPLNPSAGVAELAHVVDDCRPALVACGPNLVLPDGIADRERLDVHLTGPTSQPDDARSLPPTPAPGDPALVVYTSGTTGAPKGVLLSHGALAHDLDSLALAWRLSPDDVLVQSLPLFHVHGLVLGILGPLRLGATVRHLGRFDARTTIETFDDGATVLYGVPTMYHRLADTVSADGTLARTLGRARLLVSGSAGLPSHDRDRIATATELTVLERYGMSETLITCAMTVDGGGTPGTVGPPLPGVDLRIVTDHRDPVAVTDLETVGEIEVRGPTLFDGYLGQPEATTAAFTPDGYFRTGDLATWGVDGAVVIAGRRSVDLIKTGGYRVGAGEVENSLLTHPSVAEVAVTAEADADLGERIVAWVVPVPGHSPRTEDLAAHVTAHLSAHKRPRVVHLVDHLPRNELGKVLKKQLTT